MRSGKCLQVGLISFLIFTFLCSPLVTCTSRFNTALAAAEQTIEPEGPNGHAVNDPYEGLNRKVFEFNDRVYFYGLKPVATVYAAILPPDLRTGIKNGFHNLVFPCRFINSVLQGKPDKAWIETVRFVINSTIGLIGLFDVAQTNFGLAGYDPDFGQTLALWGVGSGPFLMIPLLGPSDERDLFGYAVDSVMDPLFWIPVQWYVTFAAESGKYINRTSLRIGEYEELKKASLDPYVAEREAYIQYREHLSEKPVPLYRGD
ncbi:MAG: VacJ family lipoprotein [Syntrophobacteraceae bacterium]